MTDSVKPITKKRLENIALYYLGRYESSTANLRSVLRRRVKKAQMRGADVPPDADEWIEAVVAQMVHFGYVDDDRYAERQIEKLKAAGKSRRFIEGKLMQAGVGNQNGLPDDEDDLQSAICLVKKKKIGFMRDADAQTAFFKKDLAVLARAGFSYDTAVKALNVSGGEENGD